MGKAGVSKSLGLAAALALAGAAFAQTSYPPAPYLPGPYGPPPSQSAYAPRPTPDQCGARDLQYLVGKPTTEIPIPVEPSRRRVVCTTCPMTRETYSFRQTILFDANTGLVTSVACG
jgi:hypothetical protein